MVCISVFYTSSIGTRFKVKHVTGTTMLSSLIEAVNKLEALELLSVKLHEEEHAMKKHNVPAIMHDSQINLF